MSVPPAEKEYRKSTQRWRVDPESDCEHKLPDHLRETDPSYIMDESHTPPKRGISFNI
jgi:hypothetical protein